jgi:hypothetical protein
MLHRDNENKGVRGAENGKQQEEGAGQQLTPLPPELLAYSWIWPTRRVFPTYGGMQFGIYRGLFHARMTCCFQAVLHLAYRFVKLGEKWSVEKGCWKKGLESG